MHKGQTLSIAKQHTLVYTHFLPHTTAHFQRSHLSHPPRTMSDFTIIEDDFCVVDANGTPQVCKEVLSPFTPPVPITPSPAPTLTLRDALAYRQENYTVTENGALTLATPQPIDPQHEQVSGRMNFFFKATRNLKDQAPMFHDMWEAAHKESVRDTLVLCFHLRNCRGKGKGEGGKGERELFRQCVRFYENNGMGHLITKNLAAVAKFGRWDDVLCCPGGLQFMARQLLQDVQVLDAINNKDENKNAGDDKSSAGRSVSLAAKWAPTCNSRNKKSKGNHVALVAAIQEELRASGRVFRDVDYRKMISRLRAHLNVTERLMCGNQWDQINFNQVPSLAMHQYGKSTLSAKNSGKRKRTDDANANSGAFLRHCGSRFEEWRGALKKGKTEDGEVVKVNASQLYPYQLVSQYVNSGCAFEFFGDNEIRRKVITADPLIDAQWAAMEAEVRSRGVLSNCLFVTDVSGSMASPVSDESSASCMDVAISLGLLGARCGQGPFKDMVITFESQPKFFQVPQESLFEAVNSMKDMEWGGSTNLQAVFDLILTEAVRHKLTQEAMPKAVVIISDMEFNQACDNNSKTNFEVIAEKYAAAGYQRPSLVFWNVQSRSMQCPLAADEQNTMLLSGFSSSMLDMLMDDGWAGLNPWKAVRKLIDSKVYECIVV
jgi:hypothetical protein